MTKRVSQFFASAAVLVLAACGSSEGGPNWASKVDDATATLAGEDAAAFAEALAYNMLYGNPNLEIPLVKGTTSPNYAEQLLAQVRAKAYQRAKEAPMATTPSPFRVSAVCEPTETGVDEFGVPIDTDGDGVPNDYTLNFGSACVETSGDATYTYSGSIRIRDVAGLFAYRLDLNNLKLRYADPSGFEQILMDGFESAVYASTAITHQTDATYAISYQYDDAVVVGPQPVAIVSGSIAFTYKENTAYDPDGTITIDAPIPNGTLSGDLDYRIIASGEEGTGAFRFTMATTQALAIDNTSCYGPTDGTIVGDLNGDADIGFTIDWSACNTYTVTTRGTTPVAVAGW